MFVENGGQLQHVPGNDKVLYHADFWGVDAYFTTNGVMYSYEEATQDSLYKGLSIEERAERWEEMKANALGNTEEIEKNTVKPKTDYLTVNWEGSNPSLLIQPQEMRSDYHMYFGRTPDGYIRVGQFKQVL